MFEYHTFLRRAKEILQVVLKEPGFVTCVAFVVLVEIFVLLYIVPSLRQLQVGSMQISRPPQAQTSNPVQIFYKDFLEKCHILCGPKEESSEVRLNPAHWALEPEYGQFLLFLLFDRMRSKDALMKEYGKNFSGARAEEVLDSNRDGVLYFFYDLGANNTSSRQNLRAYMEQIRVLNVLVRPISLDFSILSVPEEEHWAGCLQEILRLFPEAPVFVPPGEDVTKYFESHGLKIPKLVQLKPGYTQMTKRFATLVLPYQDMATGKTRYEVDLVLGIKGGVAVASGAGRPGIFRILRETKSITKKEILLFIGGTGLLLGDLGNQRMEEIRALVEEFPRMIIYPDYSTSTLAQNALKEVFGPRYRYPVVGTTIPLPNPSWVERAVFW